MAPAMSSLLGIATNPSNPQVERAAALSVLGVTGDTVGIGDQGQKLHAAAAGLRFILYLSTSIPWLVILGREAAS